MKRAWLFCRRNIKEMLKDPLSWIFALGFPVLMLILFAVVNRVVQNAAADAAEQAVLLGETAIGSAPTDTFEMKNNAPAMAFFGLTFLMLTVTLLVSKDRSTAFLTRLYSSPMRAPDYILGYMLPGLALCLAQQLVCYSLAELIGVIEGANFNGEANVFSFGRALLCVLSQIPSMILFVALGVLFGTVLGEKSAPPCVSIVINVAGIFGGCYFPLGLMGGFATACKALPFYPQVLASQALMGNASLGFGNFWGYLLIVSGYAVLIAVAAVLSFSYKMRKAQ